MPLDRSDPAALLDMRQAGQTVCRYLQGKTRDDYAGDALLRHAVERNIEIIGEAARRVSAAFRDAHPQIP